MKNDIDNTNLTRERLLWVGALVLTALVFLLIGLSAPMSFSNMRGDGAEIITIDNTNQATSSNVTTTTDVQTSVASTVAPSVTSSVSSASGKININTATVQELMSVPGIGEVLAQRIVDYRDTHNGFSCLEDLMEVDGIGERRYNTWAPYPTVG